MRRPEQEVFERLGDDGLSHALDDLLDKNRLVRLANACGLKYPGMRARSQTRARLLSDLVAQADKEEAARKAIYRVLQKETHASARAWSALSPEERNRRLGDEGFLRAKGNLGRHLYLLARNEGDPEQDGFDSRKARRQLLAIASNGGGSQAAPQKPGTSRDEARLNKRIVELQKKVKRLEAQLLKSRETEKSSKRDLIQRKGELAESRMLAERLRREYSDFKAATKGSASQAGSAASNGTETLAKSVRKLVAEQKKLAGRIDKLAQALPADGADQASLQLISDLMKQTQRELTAIRKERKQERDDLTRRIDELKSKVAAAVASRKPKRSRARGEARRVGVFIDVQNVYYGARRLKGKLDFDALIEAAVLDRRLIQAAAYVVESKEIDQSGFIAVLQQRAIEVHRKTLQVRADGSMKGDWDMELALDILDAAPNLDVVVLVSGDGDFTSLVKRVKKMGPRVEVIGFPRTTAKSLLQAADRFLPLDRKFMIYSRPSKSTREATSPKPAAKTPPTAESKSKTRGAETKG